uniref:Uncharacterized protein n=1 Tax=Anopheles minimus TaxID=112268 RepID=A0A182WFY1_9DIPT
MERVWRKVNQGLTLRSSSSKATTATGVGGGQTVPNSSSAIAAGSSIGTGNAGPSGVPHSTDTTSSAGFGESQVVAVQRRRTVVPQASTASSEKRRRRRRRSRPSREGASQSGHGSGGHHKGHSSNGRRGNNQSVTIAQQSNEQSLRQRAVARLKMFNFNLNWDLHMTQCKPCGPKSSGNIITRRLCRNRRGEDNELYRSNSFKFERFERKDPMGTGARTMLRKQ